MPVVDVPLDWNRARVTPISRFQIYIASIKQAPNSFPTETPLRRIDRPVASLPLATGIIQIRCCRSAPRTMKNPSISVHKTQYSRCGNDGWMRMAFDICP